MQNNSTKRFSNRVEDYVKYRPGYPDEIVRWLEAEFSLSAKMIIADIGSGTGISSELFLRNNYKIIGVEPNKEMREMSIRLLSHNPHFKAIDGTAEASNLPDDSIDVIVSGHAFHWFDRQKTKPEFQRVLRDSAMVILIWNERLTSSAFEKEYDQLIIKHGHDYMAVDHRNIDQQRIDSFFYPHTCELKIFPNQQVFDFDGLKGRLLSSSYMPSINDDGYTAMIDDLHSLFEKYSDDKRIIISYDTKVYVGRL
ncbi:MAG: class I SAM-dependent methyltransferase [Chitinophagaceae bacterium]